VIQSLVLTNNAVKVTWTAVAGHIYRLQAKDNLSNANWTDVLPEVAASGVTATTTDSTGILVRRFYRVWLRM
jgi:hypothetical protein